MYNKQNFEDGQVLKAEHLNHMEDELARPKSWNELTDKPFGDELVELVPETEVIGEDDGSGVYGLMIDATAFSGQEAKLFVTFDGVKYTCNDVSSIVGYPRPMFGNSKLIGAEDTGEAFCMIVDAEQGAAILLLDDANRHNISISGISSKKLPINYYDGVAKFYFTGDDDCYLYTNRMCTKPATKKDVGALLGRFPIMLSAADQIFLTVTVVENFMERQYIVLHANGKAYYTAEYTPET
jgi:hypothetical protein